MKKKINLIITILYLAIALLFWKWLGLERRLAMDVECSGFGYHSYFPSNKEGNRKKYRKIMGRIKENAIL